MPVNFIVIGNCQARPVAEAIELMTDGQCKNKGVVITHLAKNSEKEQNLKLLDGADLIFAQLVHKTYPINYIRTDFLKSEYGEKLISWPNIFFSGQSPGLCYATSSDNKRIVGPLHEYQYLPIFDSYLNGLTVSECLARIRSAPSSFDFESYLKKAFTELCEREINADIAVSDLIKDRWLNERLFFTFNHPSANLVLNICNRFLQTAGIQISNKPTPEIMGEPLSKIVPPVSSIDANLLNLQYETTELSKGVDFSVEGGKISLGKGRIYTMPALIESTYSCLDQQLHMLSGARLTPS